eukprot:TRINITY_DN3893_c0_g1_i12.p1 TRINITY_DN3893_c0_g1~~TRINITY_DN3893_c0_g1_i12.p1  ORF type:complete len:472 (+),score=114.85 TRINITY_DN3893_c0_g1_i12:507-1922(+)
MLSLDIKTQLTNAKEELLHYQKQLETELSAKLLGSDTVADAYMAHINECKVNFQEILGRLDKLEQWKSSFERGYKSHGEEIRGMIKSAVTKEDLSKYNEEQTEVLDLKLKVVKGEMQDLGEKLREVKTVKGRIAELSNVSTEVQSQLNRLERNMKDQGIEKMDEMEKEISLLKKNTEEQIKKLQKETSNLKQAASTQAKPNETAPALKASVEELNEVINGTVSNQNNLMKRIADIEERLEEAGAPSSLALRDHSTLGERIKALEEKQTEYSETIRALNADMEKFKTQRDAEDDLVRDYRRVSDKEEDVENSKELAKEAANIENKEIKEEDSKDEADFKDALIENMFGDSDDSQNNKRNVREDVKEEHLGKDGKDAVRDFCDESGSIPENKEVVRQGEESKKSAINPEGNSIPNTHREAKRRFHCRLPCRQVRFCRKHSHKQGWTCGYKPLLCSQRTQSCQRAARRKLHGRR